VLIKPLPYPDPERLITMSHAAPGVNIADLDSSPFLYFTERDHNQTLEGVALWSLRTGSVTGVREPEEVLGLFVSSEFLGVLGIAPQLGRPFSIEDDTPGSPLTIILTHGYWQRRFGGDASIVGQRLVMDGEPRTVIGVLPQRFRFLNFRQVDFLSPGRVDRSQVFVGNYYWPSIARLKPGVTIDQASADVRRMIPIAIDAFPLRKGTDRQQVTNARLQPNLRPLKQDVVGDAGNALWVVMGTIGMVLLIACANVANLLLVRAEGRQHELAVRSALGAGWGRIAGELLTESAVLSALGGALGVGVAFGGLRLLLAMESGSLPRLDDIAIDPTVLLFAVAVSLLSGLLFGLIPAIRYARPGLAGTLRAGARSVSGSKERVHARGVLVVVQVALALVLLVSAGLMIRTFQQLRNVDTGFAHASELQTVRITIPPSSVPSDELTLRRQHDILERISALPGVTAAAFINSLPLDRRGGNARDLLVPEGRVFSEGDRPQLRNFKFVSPGALQTMGIPLIAGRDLTWTDAYERRAVVVISENLAREEWGSAASAMGKRLRGSSANDLWREVVGVVGDIRDAGLIEPATELVYFPALVDRIFNAPRVVQRSVAFIIRSPRAGTSALMDDVRRAVSAVDPGLPLANVRTMGEILDESLARTSFTLVMLAIAGVMALLLGVIGIYGVIAYTVSQSTREVGIRFALGAQSSQVLGLFIRRGLVLTAVGMAIGLAIAGALTRWISALLFDVSPLDPITYVSVCVVLITAAVLASYIPSRRAARIDPINVLRAD
jgi:predicted permease